MPIAMMRARALDAMASRDCGSVERPALPTEAERARWQARASRVRIDRDNWGIAHIHGHTDADAVFGLMFAQAEDDFVRIEENLLTALGRRAECDGPNFLYADLRARLFVDEASLKAAFAASPEWLRTLMLAWADGLNHFMHCRPDVRPRLLRKFEPWMALGFTEGSVGGDIERVSIDDLRAFYEGSPVEPVGNLAEHGGALRAATPFGSNGIAIGPSISANGHPLLLINPHPGLFFRTEVQLRSDEGLNAYGTATWGQFFIYQGFNEGAAWSLTTSGADNVDEYAEHVVERNGALFYHHGETERPLTTTSVSIAYREGDAPTASRSFATYRTHHGPIVRKCGSSWISVALMQRPVEALAQSFLRMKATDYTGYREVAAVKANAIANTIFADSRGNIAYFHPDFIPRRDDRLDFTRPVRGSDPATDWQGLHDLEDAPHLLNPRCGWIANTNNWPFSAAGTDSPDPATFPRYMDCAGENPRGVHVRQLLEGRTGFTLSSLIETAYSPYLPGFAKLVPSLLEAFDAIPADEAGRAPLAEPIEMLRQWDCRSALESIATSLAIFWGEALIRDVSEIVVSSGGSLPSFHRYLLTGAMSPDIVWSDINQLYELLIHETTGAMKIEALHAAVEDLTWRFGTWRVEWGEINRYQRLASSDRGGFDDERPSAGISLVSSFWGALASCRSVSQGTARRRYATAGNSFVAVVELGPKIRALATSAGGASGDPASPHYNDQGTRFATGAFRTIHFYPDEVEARAVQSYRPGPR